MFRGPVLGHRAAVSPYRISHWFVMDYHGFFPLKPNDIAVPGAQGNAEGNKCPGKHPIQPLSSCSPGSYPDTERGALHPPLIRGSIHAAVAPQPGSINRTAFFRVGREDVGEYRIWLRYELFRGGLSYQGF
jgi:hypothetical protein